MAKDPSREALDAIRERQLRAQEADPFLSRLKSHPIFTDNVDQDSPAQATDQTLAVNLRTHLYALVHVRGAAQLRCLDLKRLKVQDDKEQKALDSLTYYQTIKCVDKKDEQKHGKDLLQKATSLMCNQGSFLCAWSRRSLVVVRLPKHVIELEQQPRYADYHAFELGSFYTASEDIVQVAWHPLSESHLVVLSASGTCRMFDVQGNPDVAEQEWSLPGKARAVAFTFGPPRDWARFCIYSLDITGALYCLCPVVPHGCLLPESILRPLLDLDLDLGKEHDIACREWVQAVLRSPVNDKRLGSPDDPLFFYPPHLDSALAADWQGPLENDAGGNAVALACLQERSTPTCLLRCFQDGKVDVLVSPVLGWPAFKHKGAARAPDSLQHMSNFESRFPVQTEGPNYRLVLDPYDPNVVFVQGRGVQMLQMSWLTKLRLWMQQPEDPQSQQLDDAMAEPTQLRTVVEDGSISGFQLISVPWLGRYCVVDRPRAGQAPSADVRAAPRLAEFYLRPEGLPEEGDSQPSPFVLRFNEFRDKYPAQGFGQFLKAEKSKLQMPIRMDSCESNEQLLDLRKNVYDAVYKDVVATHTAMIARVDELGAEATKQDYTLTELDGQIVELMEAHKRFQERVKRHKELNAELLKRIGRIQHEGLLSEAEQDFHAFLDIVKHSADRLKKAQAEVDSKHQYITNFEKRRAPARGQEHAASNMGEDAVKRMFKPKLAAQIKAQGACQNQLKDLEEMMGGISL